MDRDVVTSNHGAHRNMLVGMAGTFDIENYGDLLFPLIAAEALQRRDPRIRVVPYALNGKSDPSWPFQVRPLEQLPASVSRLSAMLIGGGQIVRFDKAYPVSVPTHVDVPIAYWLVPAVLAATAGTPVIWNAVGVWTGSPRAPWNDDLLCQPNSPRGAQRWAWPASMSSFRPAPPLPLTASGSRRW